MFTVEISEFHLRKTTGAVINGNHCVFTGFPLGEFMAYEEKALSIDHLAATPGFVIVRVAASPEGRWVRAECKVDGILVASADAADNSAPNVISSSTQSFTVPVHGNSKYRVDPGDGSQGTIEVRWAVI